MPCCKKFYYTTNYPQVYNQFSEMNWNLQPQFKDSPCPCKEQLPCKEMPPFAKPQRCNEMKIYIEGTIRFY